MFQLKFTINGKPFNRRNLKNALLSAAIENVAEKIQNALPAAESAQITIDLAGQDGNHSIELRGPEEIIAKARRVLDV